ncbi:HD domain-containing phosphohydrolase, partial [Saccharospirillum sp. MSK14-1]|uniref:HD domain-containing phosphohydrolase n=1 Tax=Saccharospirillum sp. MSK14-1 TaxID=1897632 RepID=UPI003519FD44
LDGSGYPYCKSSAMLDKPSRIVAIADIFQALSQDRPYRGRLNLSEILTIMSLLAEEGKIDDQIFSVLHRQGERYYSASIN